MSINILEHMNNYSKPSSPIKGINSSIRPPSPIASSVTAKSSIRPASPINGVNSTRPPSPIKGINSSIRPPSPIKGINSSIRPASPILSNAPINSSIRPPSPIASNIQLTPTTTYNAPMYSTSESIYEIFMEAYETQKFTVCRKIFNETSKVYIQEYHSNKKSNEDFVKINTDEFELYDEIYSRLPNAEKIFGRKATFNIISEPVTIKTKKPPPIRGFHLRHKPKENSEEFIEEIIDHKYMVSWEADLRVYLVNAFAGEFGLIDYYLYNFPIVEAPKEVIIPPHEIMAVAFKHQTPGLILPNFAKSTVDLEFPQGEDDFEVCVFKEENMYLMIQGNFFLPLESEDIVLNYLRSEVKGENRINMGDFRPSLFNCKFSSFKQYLSLNYAKLYSEMRKSGNMDLLESSFYETMNTIYPRIKLSRNLEYNDDPLYTRIFNFLQTNCTIDPKEKITLKSLKDALQLDKDSLIEYLEIIQADNNFVMKFDTRVKNRITSFKGIKGLKY